MAKRPRRVPGVCIDCRRPASGEMSRCEPCRLKHNAQKKARHDARLAQGTCPYCERPLTETRTCAVCLARRRELRRDTRERRSEEGICWECKHEAVTAQHCPVHQARHNECQNTIRRRKRAAAALAA